MNNSYSFGNVGRMHEVMALESSVENNHTALAVTGLVVAIALCAVVSVYNPLAGFTQTAGMAEVLKDAILFKPF